MAMSGYYRKWQVVRGNERWWHEMNGDDRKWIVMTWNEWRWQKMNGDNIGILNERKLYFDLVVSSYLTSAYISGVPSKNKNNSQCTVTYCTRLVFVNS